MSSTTLDQSTAAAPTRVDTPEKGTRLRRNATGIIAITGGATMLAGFLTCNWENGATQEAYLHSLLAAPGMSMISMVLLHYGYLAFVPLTFVLARLARKRAPKLAAAGLVFSVLGAGLSGLLVTDAYDLSIAQHVPMATALQIEDGISLGGMLSIGLPTAFGALIGLVVLFAAMWRARWISWLPVAAMTVGWVAGYHAHTLLRAGSGAALVTIALVAVGVRILRMSDTEFATGEPA